MKIGNNCVQDFLSITDTYFLEIKSFSLVLQHDFIKFSIC